MTTGKRCCDILAQERAKRARKEEKKSVQCLLCTMHSGVLKKKFSDLSAQEGTKGARRETRKKNRDSAFSIICNRYYKKKTAGVYPIARYSSNHCRGVQLPVVALMCYVPD